MSPVMASGAGDGGVLRLLRCNGEILGRGLEVVS